MSDRSLIQTERLILRHWREDDLKVCSRVGKNPC